MCLCDGRMCLCIVGECACVMGEYNCSACGQFTCVMELCVCGCINLEMCLYSSLMCCLWILDVLVHRIGTML